MQSDTLRLGFVGAIAASASLAVTELVASLFTGVRSPLLSVGDIVIDFSPDWLEQWAIATFGTNDKAVLIGSMIGVIVLRQIPSALDVLGVLLVMIGVAVHKPSKR